MNQNPSLLNKAVWTINACLKCVILSMAIVSAILVRSQSSMAQECTSQPVTAGYRDFNFGRTVISTPTAEKPESKLWWNDGIWWGSLWDPSGNSYRIHRFDLANQCWVSDGPDIDNRSGSLSDALWDGQKLYIVSHVQSGSNPSRLYRYSYNAVADSYTLDSGFPVNVNQSGSETLTIAKDSTGKLWVAWENSSKIWINRSTTDDKTWGTAFNLPVQGGRVAADDIAAVVKFSSNQIGVMWSNQNDKKMYFAIHNDGDGDAAWQPREEALADQNLGAVADDHINLKITSDNGGEVYAVTKTSLSGLDAPLIFLLKRNVNGSWSRHVVGMKRDDHTRPIVMIDDENRKLYVFAKSDKNASGVIRMKSTDLDNISFAPGVGEAFIQSSSDRDINNPSSTKQNVNSSTGLLLLASDATSHNYMHNYIDLSGNRPVISSFAPASGLIGTEVTVSGSNFTGVTAVAVNGVSVATFTADSALQLRLTVPDGATSGKITVTNANGTGTSANDFAVILPPTITSFSPTSGPIGTEVTVAGSEFVGVTAVAFNGVSASSFTVDSGSELRATVPVGASTGQLSVSNAAG
ncbi:MAG: IPT/TIG domain-containing protein, partial [bacterium]